MSPLRDLVQAAPPGTEEALAALACAESLTDSVAVAIYERAPVPGLDARDFISAFKYSGLTEPRNSEWNLAPALRRELLASPALDADIKQAVHQFLLELGKSEANRTKAGSEVPAYLFTHAGLAYHFAGSGDLDDAMAHYSEASKGAFTGAQWLGAKFAEEQERNGVIPHGRVETTFLRAWVLLREGHRQAAMPLFRRVAETDLPMREVAISLHIVGNENNRGQRRAAEGELRRSIEIGEKTGDRFGVAQRLHSLANFVARQAGRFGEAEKIYERSIEIGEELGNRFHIAQPLHSLANLLARKEGRFDEAEKTYERSIEIGEETGDHDGVAQRLHGLANLLVRQDRFDEAEKTLKRSVEIGEKIGVDVHVAQVLHSLANLMAQQDRLDEAEEAYKRSIKINEGLGHQSGIAQVLMSYGTAIATRSIDRALALLHRSLDIERRRGNQHFIRMVERRIEEVRERR